MLESGVSLDRLFESDGPGKAFPLVPKPRSSVPLQWAHVGPGAIPNALVDTPCTAISIKKLLKLLNNIFGTRYPLGKPGLERCLDHFLHSSRDFGQVYGFLRRHWKSDFTQLLPYIAEKQREDEATRRDALDGGYISNSRVPPRRVWDLYSNRVLPIYAMGRDRNSRGISSHVWTVSHSWVQESARIDVWTPINGYEWPVSMPSGTTLEHVRVELLNLGARYIWLDILCLRQRGRVEDEEQRKEEWKLDVPTIGFVYSFRNRPCVTYFNGLGLPFDPSPQVLSSDRHWFNRIWTVQEATNSWLPGGATGVTSADTRRFFREHLPRYIPEERDLYFDHVAFAVPAMQGRHCTTELDRVHGLAYILNCMTLPIYDEGMSPDLAWTVLLKHMNSVSRYQLALRHVQRHPDDDSLLPSWQEFMHYGREDITRQIGSALGWLHLHLPDPSRLHMPEAGTYFQEAIVSHGSVRIIRKGDKDEFGHETLELQTQSANGDISYDEIQDCKVFGTFPRSVKYIILKLALRVWLVAEVTGRRRVEGKPATEVIKRGCIFPPTNQFPCFQWCKQCIVYISG
ncbi:uncharacterized protein PHACADRAFT_260245 [Phanerochaete carnosa HHB-10118-sp]|uniref:Heterokaryon incompatibility domain-containing protein n=1 Tax=Phanerochaete carnosa (strain HHB-10118-sp) TaxID=650164 RepID=K5W472_PHACS|nr:uncharacterized protein PHACADRAFT_260245 [Phanerochaete carnosa HHB-10118-sp]EKM53749.1 hypothetical protein PHACADRAFT_260245 [Phanerochaete carnosa HHB-10118-sp]